MDECGDWTIGPTEVGSWFDAALGRGGRLLQVLTQGGRGVVGITLVAQ